MVTAQEGLEILYQEDIIKFLQENRIRSDKNQL